MQPYTSFAQVYDTFMDNVPYEDWSARIQSILKQYDITSGLALDLGCGTGKMTELLATAGYDMIGVDNSEDMLELAMEKRLKSGHDILYLLQNMQEFELYGTVGAIVSVCDSVNYMVEEEELLEVFRLANNYLDPEGIFLFDFNTEYKYREILGDNTFAEERETCSFIWENYYAPEEKINEYELTLFVQEQDDPMLYRRYQETHFQRAYTLERIKQMIQRSGMKYVQAFDGYTDRAPTYTSERILVVAQECGK
ncbi:class I SAM-dependent methyltransferase [Lachnospiraceae bacterium KGMB03038]|nr:class I SAM-dependent methyltransferase [Lachnospiraceae bacterium KGMB03038]